MENSQHFISDCKKVNSDYSLHCTSNTLNMEATNPKLIELGKKIREARKLLNYTQVELANETGIDRSYISMIEKGVTNPSYLKIKRLEEALGDKF